MEVETPLANKDGRLSGLAVSPGWASSCGRVVLYRADCREVLPTLARPAAIITDPPYGISFAAQPTKWQRLAGKQAEAWDDATVPDVVLALPGMAPLCVVWGGNYYPLPCTRGWLMWDKLQSNRGADCELAWVQADLAPKVFRMSRIDAYVNRANGLKKTHSAQKPLPLMEWCIDNLKLPLGSTIFDPFMGSGTTGVAAINKGMRFVGIERDPKHFQTAVERITAALSPKHPA